MSAVILIAITSVFHHGQIIPPGREFACDMEKAKKYVEGGSAKLKNSEKTNETVDPKRALLEGLTVQKLTSLAEKKEVSLDSATKKPDIIQKILDSGVEINETDI